MERLARLLWDSIDPKPPAGWQLSISTHIPTMYDEIQIHVGRYETSKPYREKHAMAAVSGSELRRATFRNKADMIDLMREKLRRLLPLLYGRAPEGWRFLSRPKQPKVIWTRLRTRPTVIG